MSSGILRLAAFVRIDVSEKRIASIIRVTRIAVNMMMEAILPIKLQSQGVTSKKTFFLVIVLKTSNLT
jgi:hypothetical protein